jgi:antibiotic biosynthesis monooxygenase (ABM) superfamily enzyme
LARVCLLEMSHDASPPRLSSRRRRSSRRSQSQADDGAPALTPRVHNASVRKALHHDDQIVVVCLHLRVKLQNLVAVRAWYERGAHVAHSQKGHVLSSFIIPATSANARFAPVRDALLLYAFATQADADRWHASDAKRKLMDEAAPLIESSVLLGSKSHPVDQADPNWGAALSGWETIFASDERGDADFSPVPPAWKIAVMVYLAVCIVIIPLSLPGSLNEAIGRGIGLKDDPWRVPLAILLGNLVGVPLINFLVLPTLIKVFGGWLHAAKPRPPTPESGVAYRQFYTRCC